MTAVPTYAPGLAASSEDAFTQDNTILAGQAPTLVSYGKAIDDLPQYTLVGRVTATGLLVASAAAAADGSQNPIGVTTHAVTNNDSNSVTDSNSSLDAGNGVDVGFYRDGVFNFDRLNKGAGWTLDSLRANLEANGQGFSVDVIKTATPSNVGLE